MQRREHRIVAILLALMSLALLGNGVTASPDLTTFRYVIYRGDDIPCQTLNISTSSTSPDGVEGLYIEQEILSLLDLHPMAPLTILETSSKFSDKDFKPRWLTYSYEDEHLRGYVDPDTGEIRLESPSFPTLTIGPPEREWYFLEHFLAKLTAQGFEYNKVYNCVTWLDNILDFVDMEVTFLEEVEYECEEGRVYKIKMVIDGEEQLYYMDSSNILYHTESPIGSFEIVLLKDNEFPVLKPYNFSSLISSNAKIITNPDAAISSQILLSFQTSPPFTLTLTDNRQTITEEIGGHIKLQTVKEGIRDLSGRSNLDEPWTGLDGYEEYIAPTKFIESQDPQIIHIANQIVGEERDTWKAVTLLMKWTYNYVEISEFPPVLRTTALLTTMKGVPTSRPALFASLARSLGIPTKLVLGIHYKIGGIFLPHIWNEVWVGEWIAVDPYYNNPAPGALQIKLFEDTCVHGMLHCVDLDKIKVTILDASSIDPEHGPASLIKFRAHTTGEYFDEKMNFRVIAAPDKWDMVQIQSRPEESMLMISSALNPEELILITPMSVAKGITAELMIPLMASAITSNASEGAIIKEIAREKLSLNNKNNASITFEFTQIQDEPSLSVITQIVLIVDENKLFYISYAAPASVFEEGKHDFLEILQNLETHIAW